MIDLGHQIIQNNVLRLKSHFKTISNEKRIKICNFSNLYSQFFVNSNQYRSFRKQPRPIWRGTQPTNAG
jgi:hypothetical protein